MDKIFEFEWNGNHSPFLGLWFCFLVLASTIILVCRLRKPRVGTWSSSDMDSLLRRRILLVVEGDGCWIKCCDGLRLRSVERMSDAAAAAAMVAASIPAAAIEADDSVPKSRGVDGNDSWLTFTLHFNGQETNESNFNLFTSSSSLCSSEGGRLSFLYCKK